MADDRIEMKDQIVALERLRSGSMQCRNEIAEVQRLMAEIRESGEESCRKLRSDLQTRLRMDEERTAREYHNYLQQTDTAVAQHEQTLAAWKERVLADLRGALDDSCRRLQKALDDEVWVLQSVNDETGDDSPTRKYERTAEAGQTHFREATGTLEKLDQRIAFTAGVLKTSHAATETDLPQSNNGEQTLEESQECVTAQTNEAFRLADEIDRLLLPQFFSGLKAPVIAVGLLILLTFGITSVKTDIRQFLNPELGSPDWMWLGISGLIAGGVTAMVMTVLLITVRQALRSRFSRMLQCSANAQAASASWQSWFRQQLREQKAAADHWMSQVVQRRDQRIAAIRADHAAKLLQTQETSRKNEAQILWQAEQQMRAISERGSQSRAAAEKWRQETLRRMRSSLTQETQNSIERQTNQAAAQLRVLIQRRTQLLAMWHQHLDDVGELAAASGTAAVGLTAWPMPQTWQRPASAPRFLPVGDLTVALPCPPAGDARLPTEPSAGDEDFAAADIDFAAAPDSQPAELHLMLPALLRFPEATSIVVEHDATGRDAALDFLRALLLRILTTVPPGRVQFTLIDPIGLGQSFSALMHLADFDEQLIGHRIWTDAAQIRERLQKITEHMETVFQTCLRSEFDTIEDYNVTAGEVAEPWHFVVIAGFPAAFSEESARHLTSILTSGPRCGVRAIVAWTPDQEHPRSFRPADLTSNCVRFRVVNGEAQPLNTASHGVSFQPLQAPAASSYVNLVRAVGERSKNARRVEVSFGRISPHPDEIWTHSAAETIDLPIGRAGATRLQHFRLGTGTSQHVLIAGKTGSGKSTLLHILITNMAQYYSPDEIQFYLIDFKKGVEFRTYATGHLPHARVIAIESDREFGLSVLDRLDEILQERGDVFRQQGVQDLAAFRRHCPQQPLPRLLLLIDEFQEFFTTEDRIASRASLLLDRLVRQGRAFGIHVVLGSQTLGGAYSLARSTLGQVAVRIALQCSESDSHLILSEDNPAARLLSRPGEAIYNDANGLVEGNHPFQIAWLGDAERDRAIRALREHSRQQSLSVSRTIVFEGNVPPTVDDCGPLQAWLNCDADAVRTAAHGLPIWIGEPVAIAAPTCVQLRRTSGQNVLIVGQDAEMADVILLMSVLCCCRPAAGSTSQAAEIEADSAPEPVGQLLRPHCWLLADDRTDAAVGRFQAALGDAAADRLSIVPVREIEATISQLHQQLPLRQSGDAACDQPTALLVIRSLSQFRSLRRDDDDFSLGSFGTAKTASTATLFAELIKQGPAVGIHVVVWVDSFSNAVRWLSTSLLREFENRIAFRLNPTDSASLLDTPDAAALTGGRAILYRDQTGAAEKFRPFAWPETRSISPAADDHHRDPILLQNAPRSASSLGAEQTVELAVIPATRPQSAIVSEPEFPESDAPASATTWEEWEFGSLIIE